MVMAVRGAIQIKSNESRPIEEAVVKLVESIVAENKIVQEDVISIMFSQTKDLTAINPATALRRTGFSQVPLFCTQEPDYAGSMPRVIRVMVSVNVEKKTDPVPVYLDGAEMLRKDIFGKE
jgi:chorismate mutase